MIFALATDDRTLCIFASVNEAIAYAEGVDVEDGIWLFFAGDGSALTPVFTEPNERGSFSVTSGSYQLVAGSGQHLLELLSDVASVEGLNSLDSVPEVKRYLLSNPLIQRTPNGAAD